MSISAIILDLDGVLLDTERIARQAWKKSAEEFGFEFTEELYSTIVGRPVADCRKKFETSLPDGISYDQYLKRADVIYYAELDRKGVAMVRGVPALLDWIEQSGLDVAIATSSNRNIADRKLESAGLFGRIDILVTRDDVKQGKPAPDSFQLAAKLLNQETKNCVVIEDAEAGIIGASKAGAIPILMPSSEVISETARKLSYAIVTSIADVLLTLKNLTNHKK